MIMRGGKFLLAKGILQCLLAKHQAASSMSDTRSVLKRLERGADKNTSAPHNQNLVILSQSKSCDHQRSRGMTTLALEIR